MPRVGGVLVGPVAGDELEHGSRAATTSSMWNNELLLLIEVLMDGSTTCRFS